MGADHASTDAVAVLGELERAGVVEIADENPRGAAGRGEGVIVPVSAADLERASLVEGERAIGTARECARDADIAAVVDRQASGAAAADRQVALNLIANAGGVVEPGAAGDGDGAVGADALSDRRVAGLIETAVDRQHAGASAADDDGAHAQGRAAEETERALGSGAFAENSLAGLQVSARVERHRAAADAADVELAVAGERTVGDRHKPGAPCPGRDRGSARQGGGDECSVADEATGDVERAPAAGAADGAADEKATPRCKGAAADVDRADAPAADADVP